MKKSLKKLLLIGSTLGAAGIIASSVALSSCSVTSNKISNVDDLEITKNDNVVDTNSSQSIVNSSQSNQNSNLSGKARLISMPYAENTNNNATIVTPHEEVKSITKEFKSDKVWTPILNRDGSVKIEERYQSPYYFNQREVMPILTSDDADHNSNYINERSQNEVEFNRYPGWERNYNNTFFNGAILGATYTPTAALKDALNQINNVKTTNVNKFENVDALAPISAMSLDFQQLASIRPTISVEDINALINYAADQGVTFISFSGLSQSILEGIVIPNKITKLTIKDFDGNLSSFRGIKIADSVKELEFYSTSAYKVDPTILPDSSHLIYDHIDGDNPAKGKLAFKNFTMIDLSDRQDLTNDILQKALDNVYGKRQFERALNGDFMGGYIYNLDISDTPIKTLNNVYIPSQSDGRFNIAYVKWTSDKVQDGQITITIGEPSKYPTNDAQVGEWFDSSGNAELATVLKLKTEGNMELKQFQIELKALLDKYPNINKIDISEVHLLKATSQDIINAITAVWNNKYMGVESIPQLTIHVSDGIDDIVIGTLK